MEISEKMTGMRRGEVVIIGSGTGIGKSQLAPLAADKSFYRGRGPGKSILTQMAIALALLGTTTPDWDAIEKSVRVAQPTAADRERYRQAIIKRERKSYKMRQLADKGFK